MAKMTFDQVLKKVKYSLEINDSDNLRTVSFEFYILERKDLRCRIIDMADEVVDEIMAELDPEAPVPSVDTVLSFLRDECNLITPINFEAQVILKSDSAKLTIVNLINIDKISDKNSLLLLVADRSCRTTKSNLFKLAFCDSRSGNALALPEDLTKSLLSNSDYLLKHGFKHQLSDVYKELKSIKESTTLELNRANEVIDSIPDDIRLMLEAEDK